MLRPKKNLIGPLTILFVIFSLGCKTAPKKPNVELCIVNIESGEALCGNTDGGDLKAKEATYNRLYGAIKRAQNATVFPLEYIDNGVCLRPSQWGVLQNYVHNLQIYIESQCK